MAQPPNPPGHNWRQRRSYRVAWWWGLGAAIGPLGIAFSAVVVLRGALQEDLSALALVGIALLGAAAFMLYYALDFALGTTTTESTTLTIRHLWRSPIEVPASEIIRIGAQRFNDAEHSETWMAVVYVKGRYLRPYHLRGFVPGLLGLRFEAQRLERQLAPLVAWQRFAVGG
ncbi:MAG: hypothetical protein ACK5LS_00980 [Propioniciclava sp.]